MRRPVVNQDGRRRALALNPKQGATLAWPARLLLPGRLLPLARLPLLAGGAVAVQRQKVVVRDRILIFLPEQLRVVQLVEALRRRAGTEFALV
jgi:hypothetical protein